ERVRLAVLGRSNHQRPVLGADRVVGGDDAGPAVAPKRGAVDEGANRCADAKLQNEAAIDTLARGILEATGTADDRGDLGERGNACWQLPGDERGLPTAPQTRLGPRHCIDHTLVCLAGLGPKAEDAVLD